MSEKRTSTFRYWAAGVVFLIVGFIALLPISLFSYGFFPFLSYSYPNNAAIIGLTSILFTIIVVPYILGRVIKWVSEKIFQKT